MCDVSHAKLVKKKIYTQKLVVEVFDVRYKCRKIDFFFQYLYINVWICIN